MTLAYLATPYSRFPRGQNRAYIEACELAGRLILAGINVFSPIAHSHGIALAAHIDPLDQRFWNDFDAVFLEKCDTLIVAHMDGWDQSSGIAHEIAEFQKAGKSVFDLDPATLQMVKRT